MMADDAELGGIAIIGMAGRFPGADSVAALWAALLNGQELITHFSDEELAAAGVDPALLANSSYVKSRGVLADSECFDAEFFGIAAREAELIDPQQRVFLEQAWTALEHAGYVADQFDGLIGVYAGSGINTYLLNNIATNPELVATVGQFQVLIASDKDHLATRVAYKMNLRGPAVTVQTACSTSLVAVHHACQSLLSYQCDMALAGGVTVAAPQTAGYLYQEGGILAPDGHCRAFDAQAQGTLPGSGAGIVVLKRYDEALAAGDTIYAVIRASAINNDGADKIGYTVPSVNGQAEVILTTHALAEIGAETIGYVETHGTGTALGDPIEIAALTQAFRKTTSQTNFCAIGSVKSNLGHLDAAAGVTGLIKAALAVKHGVIPPSLHFSQANPALNLPQSPFFVATAPREWPATMQPRRAGVSAFGIGGTNAHALLESAAQGAGDPPLWAWQIVPLSARSDAALERLSGAVAEHLETLSDLELADGSSTLQQGRTAFEHRRVAVGVTGTAIASALRESNPSLVRTATSAATPPALVFMFSGQGSQYPAMAQQLYAELPLFRERVDRCAEILQPLLDTDIRSIISAPLAGDPGQHPLYQTQFTQPALFVIEWSLAQVLLEWGLKPAAMIGHSIGEYVAACVAGVWSLEDALRIVVERARLMQRMAPGAMLAVMASAGELEPYLTDQVGIAVINAPRLTVVSGLPDQVRQFAETLQSAGIESHALHTSHAFHSWMMEPMLSDYARTLQQVRMQAPALPFISNVSGAWITAAEATDPHYWARHVRQPVQFSCGIETLLGQGPALFVEVGPGQTLCQLVRQHGAASQPPQAVATLPAINAPANANATLALALGTLWVNGVPLEWSRLHGTRRRRRVPLPTYSFERRRFRIEPGQPADHAPARLARNLSPESWLYAANWQRTLPVPPARPAPAPWLLLVNDDPFSQALAARLAELGQPFTTVRSGPAFSQTSDTSFVVRPQELADYQALLAVLRASQRLPSRIVHLWQLGPVEPVEYELDHGLLALLALTRAVAALNRPDPLKLVVLASGLAALTPAEDEDPHRAALRAAITVVGQEYPQLVGRCIDLPFHEAARPDRWIAALVSDLAGDSEQPVAYRRGQRFAQVYQRLDAAPAHDQPRLRQGGSYLITGGTGSLGLIVARYLAERWQARLTLTSRSGLPPRHDWERLLADLRTDARVSHAIRQVTELEALGATVLVVAADSADRQQMEQCFAQARTAFGELHGIFHAAGERTEASVRTIGETGRAECLAQLRPKLDGAQVLAELSAELELDFVALFSSLSAQLGGLGFYAYAAANQAMDSWAQRMQTQRDTPWISINWDAWNTDGSAAANAGIGATINAFLIAPADGIKVLERLLGYGLNSNVIISTGDLDQRIAQWVSLNDVHAPAGGRGAEHKRPNLPYAYVAPTTPTETRLASIWENLLGIAPLGINDNFFDLGGHSLIGVQLISRLRETFSVDIPLRMLFETPTIAAIAATLQGLLDQPAPAAPAAPGITARSRDAYRRSSTTLEPTKRSFKE